MKKICHVFIVMMLAVTMLQMNIKSVEAATLVQNKMVTYALKEKGSRYKKKYGARPWCCAFVNWAARKAKVSTKVIPKTADSTTMYKKILKSGGKVVKKPQKGDLVFYRRSTGSSRMMHVAIMTSSTMSIHGNYSNKVTYMKATNYRTGRGCGPISKKRIVYVRPNYPKAPSKPTISKATLTNDKISVTWKKVSNTTAYTVYLKNSKNKVVYQKKVKSTKLSFTLPNKKESGTYSVLLRASNSIGYSAYSNAKKIKYTYVEPKPVVPDEQPPVDENTIIN